MFFMILLFLPFFLYFIISIVEIIQLKIKHLHTMRAAKREHAHIVKY